MKDRWAGGQANTSGALQESGGLGCSSLRCAHAAGTPPRRFSSDSSAPGWGRSPLRARTFSRGIFSILSTITQTGPNEASGTPNRRSTCARCLVPHAWPGASRGHCRLQHPFLTASVQAVRWAAQDCLAARQSMERSRAQYAAQRSAHLLQHFAAGDLDAHVRRAEPHAAEEHGDGSQQLRLRLHACWAGRAAHNMLQLSLLLGGS